MTNPNPIVKLDVPLLLRILEFAKEDASSDDELRKIAKFIINIQRTSFIDD